MRRPRFNYPLWTFFLEIASIAIAFGSLIIAVAIIRPPPFFDKALHDNFSVIAFLVLVAGSSFGSAIGLPFRRGIAGAVIGALLPLPIVILLGLLILGIETQ
ncbi:MAG TPA: hypothetical protein VND64_07060 [Pirellulales bacterium]|nr:hypothetical protein [Pirellulales bacterium]